MTPWTAAHQASLSITNSRSLSKLMSIELVMPSNHLTLCCPLLLLPSIFPSIRVFSNESALRIRWPQYWEFQLSLSQKQLLLSLGEDVPKHLILLPPETSLKTAISKRSHEYNDEENRRGDKSSKILKVAKQMNHGY